MSSQTNVGSLEKLDQEFHSLMDSVSKLNLSKSEIYKLLSPLRWQMFRNRWIKRIKFCALAAVFALAVYYVPFLNWNASAIGRLVMIQVLPYWDWKPLYKERCLVKEFSSSETQTKVSYGSNSPFAEDCAVCENVESITKHERVSFDYLNEHHLLRNLPVVVLDSHRKWAERSWSNSTSFLQSIEPLLLSGPCNVQTNLIFGSVSSGKAGNTLASLSDILTNSGQNDSWFLQFRNCELKTVKKARLLIERPYFYAPHLEMPYTTWFLLSNNYSAKLPKRLRMEGLVIVMQLRMNLLISLKPKGECELICSKLMVDLHDGESLMFSTNLWTFEYLPASGNASAITFISETYQN